MLDANDAQWIEDRLKDRQAARRAKRLAMRWPGLVVIDASKFSEPLSDLARTLETQTLRHGDSVFGSHLLREDIAAMLCQVRATYNALRFINSDHTRDENSYYRHEYSFATLPLVRTMIDGFYNCTALLEDPSRIRKFRASGLYRFRETLRGDEARYGKEPKWKEYLEQQRRLLELHMNQQGYTDADLDDKLNKWPLLGTYLDQKPDTPHKQLLRQMTLGFWKEYSSISHVSHDGILGIFRYIASENAPHHLRPNIAEGVERLVAMHFGRTAGVMLCLLTEIQVFCNLMTPT